MQRVPLQSEAKLSKSLLFFALGSHLESGRRKYGRTDDLQEEKGEIKAVEYACFYCSLGSISVYIVFLVFLPQLPQILSLFPHVQEKRAG